MSYFDGKIHKNMKGLCYAIFLLKNVWIFKLNKLKIKSIKLDLFATYLQ